MSKKKVEDLNNDPFYVREKEKYGNPIPSREFILAHLEACGKPTSYRQIQEDLALEDPEAAEALYRRLTAMVRDGQLMKTRKGGYALIDRMNLIAGRIMGHRDGFGFLIPDEGKDDLFLSDRQMRMVFDGDRALARVDEFARGRKAGIIVEVIERNTHQIAGRLISADGAMYVQPEHRRIQQNILIPEQNRSDAKVDQMVLAEIITQPTFRNMAVGRVVEVLGEHMGPGMEIDIAIQAHGLSSSWPEAVEQETKGFTTDVLDKDKEGRIDLRELPLVTIDGEDAKDFDDAVYCETLPRNKGWQLYVAIADVSHYVKHGSALDQEAEERGNSVYFPGRVIPMLPKVLSNGLCSLNPKVDRLCMVCKMTITNKGKIKDFEFFEALMRSHARLTYEKVAKLVADKNPRLLEQYADVLPHLKSLHGLYKLLRDVRTDRGAIDFEIPETQIIFGSNKKISDIVPRHRNDAHRLIEECMLLANTCAAEFLIKHKMQGVYRVHPAPEPDKLEELRDFLKEAGLKLGGGKRPKPLHYSRILQSVMGRPDAGLIQTVLLRSLSQAVYKETNRGHFGLAYDAYTHFTSPIRRYPDLLVHRAIKHIIKKRNPKSFIYSNKDFMRFGEHCSRTERRADDATRDVVDWLKCEYMLDKVGETFEGKISGVTSFGLFVSLNDIFVDGLVHISALSNDYYNYDALRHRLTGDVTGNTYRLGDCLKIKVADVSLDDRKINFDLAEPLPVISQKRTKSKDKRRRRR